MTAAEIAAALGAARREGQGWRCRCPAHDDNDPSLSLIERDGRVLLTCRAGCDQKAVIDVLRTRGLWASTAQESRRRTVATYNYRDEHGALRYQVVRFATKDFRQRRPNGAPDAWLWNMAGLAPLPYRLPELIGDPDATVFIAEGEKDCDALGERGFVTTTNHGGAGKWRPEISRWLAGRHVVILPDNDEPGRAHARDVAHKLAGVAASCRILELPGLPEKGDVSDWLSAGGTADELERLAAAEAEIDKPEGGLKLTSAADLVAKHFAEPKWAVPSIVAEGLTILAGKPKTGKSWLALDFATAVAGGYAALGNIECLSGPVLLLALEDNDRRLNARLKAVLQGQPAPAALQIATQWRRSDAGGLDDLRAWLAATPSARLVVIDTLQKIRGARDRSEGVYADDYKAVGDIKALADKFSVPIIVVHHLRKEAAGDPLESVSGTAGITGSADTILVLKREPNDSLGLLYVRGRDVPEAEIAMQFDDATGKWLRLVGADDFRRSRERNAIIRALLDLGEPMTPAEIADAIGKPRNSTIRVLLAKMRKAGDITKCADGRYRADNRL